MKVVVTAYACEPGAGSESGHGWNYPAGLARRGHQIFAVVPSRSREKVERELTKHPVAGLEFVYVPERDELLRLGWTVGSALRYVVWQWEAARAARRICETRGADVVHHVSYGTLLGGSFLWRTGRPFVFGPVGGGQTAPEAFLSYFGAFRRSEVLRTLVVRYLWRLDWPALAACRRASVVLAANRETMNLATRMGARAATLMPDVYLPDEAVPTEVPKRTDSSPVRVLWVGRFLARKGQQLTVEAFEQLPDSLDVELEMIGDGPCDREFRSWLAGQKEMPHAVRLRGRLPWSEVQRAYDDADIFIFTSLRDTMGIQVLEAMAHGLPVVTLDHQGAAELVTEDSGIKVPVTTVEETRRGIAGALERLVKDSDLRSRLGANGHRLSREYVLTRRLDQVEGIYRAAIQDGAGEITSRSQRLENGEYSRVNLAQVSSETDDFAPERYRQFARHLPQGCKRLLDLGCGVGEGGRVLKSLRPDLELAGLDVVEERLVRLPGGIYGEAVAASATRLPFPDSSLDAVVAGEFIEHLSYADAHDMLDEVRRVLRPNGRLLLTTPNPNGLNFRLKRMSVVGGAHLAEYSPVDLRRLLRQHGIRVIALRGSGRMTRYLPEWARPLNLFGSYLCIAEKPHQCDSRGDAVESET